MGHTLIRTPFGDEGCAFHRGPVMAAEWTQTPRVPCDSSSPQTSDCSSHKPNPASHLLPKFPLSRQLGKEKGVNTTILLATNNKGGFILQRQEPQVPSPQCLSMQYLYVVKLVGDLQQAGWELEHMMCMRRGCGKQVCVAWKKAGWGGNWLQSSTSWRGKMVVHGQEVTVTGCSKRKPRWGIRRKVFTMT